jgi:adenylate cyclase
MSAAAPAIIDWLLRDAPGLRDYGLLLTELRERLRAAGLPLGRMTGSIPTLHPEWIAARYLWVEGQRGFQAEKVLHDNDRTDRYRNNPVEALMQGAPRIRRRLVGPQAQLDFAMMTELRDQGFTDYLAFPLHLSSGRIGVFTVCATRPEGFADAEVELLDAVLPALTVVSELHAMRGVAASLLDTYVGHGAGEKVLTGQIRRGHGETRRTVLWYTDLRGFTAMSEAMPRDDVIRLLNDYFETMAGPVESLGGEVLKFIGDAMLAIFPIDEPADTASACETALTAAEMAMQRMKAVNRRRTAAPLRYGLALHLGDVMYGNIGAARRLDFTVIGAAVNLVARLEKLAGELDLTLVTSADFAAACGRELRSIGRHSLKGLAQPQEVFTAD